jgi:undecaprenyl phosphate N,N'-diacetylbacillosamine 1-phosphate transferase
VKWRSYTSQIRINIMYHCFFKSLFDYTFAILGFILLLPLFVIIVSTLYFFNKKAVFFTQERPGKNEKIFKLIKFKTMTDEKDAMGKLLSDEKRLTNVGRFIRSSSLDEIPQLINVIKGEMSLIGPRPLLVSYLPLYSKEQARRHDVKPGITGWAQINGRNSISWEKKFELDVWYVQNMSFTLDIKILFRTVRKVINRNGISGRSTSTMYTFTKE